jgi:hypothetical protein
MDEETTTMTEDAHGWHAETMALRPIGGGTQEAGLVLLGGMLGAARRDAAPPSPRIGNAMPAYMAAPVAGV